MLVDHTRPSLWGQKGAVAPSTSNEEKHRPFTGSRVKKGCLLETFLENAVPDPQLGGEMSLAHQEKTTHLNLRGCQTQVYISV